MNGLPAIGAVWADAGKSWFWYLIEFITGDSFTLKTLLRGARVLLAGEIANDRFVFVKDGRITKIGDERDSSEYASAADQILNLDGLTLVPGFIDVHIHGAVGVDVMEASSDDLLKVSTFLASKGVTGWLPTLVPGPDSDYHNVAAAASNARSAQQDQPQGAEIFGLHYEGPFVNEAQCGALRTPFFKTYSIGSDLGFLYRMEDGPAAHMITMAPEIEGGIELATELVKLGWVVSIGHTRAGLSILESAKAAGARHMTHFMNAMAPLHHRAPGPIGWGLTTDDVTCDIIADGVHTDPLMLNIAMRCKTSDRLTLISDAVAPAGMGDGDYHIWGEQITVRNGRTSNEKGSIAGSVITMLDALRMMVSTGVSIADSSKMASANPARLLGLFESTGSIAEGKRADLVALDENLNPKLTLVRGRLAYESK